MATQEHLEHLRKGSAYWNSLSIVDADLSHANLSNARLSGVVLTCANLVGVNFSHADLSGALLDGAILIGTNLCDANLRNATLRNANLIDAVFIGADLTNALLCHALLRGATFGDSRLMGTDFSYTWAGATNFSNVDLRHAKGLNKMTHMGPSSIGVDTLYLSEGRIPRSFLLGAGVPDDFMAYFDSFMVEKPIQFYSCFISFTMRDKAFADQLYADLRRANVHCWYAPYDVQGGKKLHDQLLEAIRINDKLLLVLSESSMSSEWVQTEIREARKEEVRSGKRKLFPISLVDYSSLREWRCFDGDTGKDLAREVREYYIPDFSNWASRNAYQIAFAHLLRDLNASESV